MMLSAPARGADAGTGHSEPRVPFATETPFSEAEFYRDPCFTYRQQQPRAGAEPGRGQRGTGGGSAQPLAPVPRSAAVTDLSAVASSGGAGRGLPRLPAMPCRALPCRSMLCRTMPCRAVPYHAMQSHRPDVAPQHQSGVPAESQPPLSSAPLTDGGKKFGRGIQHLRNLSSPSFGRRDTESAPGAAQSSRAGSALAPQPNRPAAAPATSATSTEHTSD